MELTQQIECTQELYANTVEKEDPCQIGFLGICGVKYPLKKGPNKIGRDPNTCNIVLNLNSISRQHAVVNILNSCDFMLMDLDSANKTKLADKTLQAYIPTPLKNGDMVQFGQVFGVFRLFEEDNDLPMTQALDIPETPVRNQHVSKVNLITTIPESPEVSDRDDSFIVASQPKPRNVFKSPSTNFIKSSGKTITIKPVGSNQIDNVYWSSSKKSDSFNLESDTSINTDTLQTSNTKDSIHEQDTQIQNNINNFIHEADTQVGDNILPFHNIETEQPNVDNLPEVHKVHGQENVNIDLFTENKENDNNIHNSETQDVRVPSEESKNLGESSKKSDVSDDIILFDEIESNPVEEDFESQDLLLPELEAIDQIGSRNEGGIEISDGEQQPPNLPISNRRDSGSSTDCEDINFALTQNIPEIRTNDDDDITDCEDAPELNELNKNHKANIDDNLTDDNLTDCENEIENNNKGEKEKIDDNNIEDLATQVIEKVPYNVRPTTSKNIPCLEDLPTQVIDEDKICRKENSRDQLDLDDLPTQILHQEPQNNISEEVTPFKVPVISPFQLKRKDQTESVPNKRMGAVKNITKDIECDDEEKYYAATQELLNDLCTQRELSPEIVPFARKNISKAASDNNQTNNISTDLNNATEDIDEKIDKFVMNLTNSVKKDDIEKEVAPLKKVSSDSSDFESTPKKLRPRLYLETKLPSTPEIQTYLKQNGYASTGSSKGSDTDCSNYGSPHKKIISKDIRVVLTTQFEPERLPERVTRVRKPTSKMFYTEDSKKNKMLQSRSFETDHSKEKETVALSKTVTSNLKEISKKQTIKTRSNKNNVSSEINKSTEIYKSKENVRTQENNKSKENVRTRENNKSKESVSTRENNKSKESVSTRENNKSKESVSTRENNKSKESVSTRENNKSKESVSTRENNKSKESVSTRENNKSKESVSTRENNKSKESVSTRENNKSKESVSTRENNKSKESVSTRENNKSKESVSTRENNKSKEHNKILEYHKGKKKDKGPEKNNENTSSIDIEKKSEHKSTRRSSRRRDDEQLEVRKDNKQLQVITDEVGPLKTETGNSTRKTNRGSKTSRKETNTIDKYLSSTSAEVQKDETKITEKKSRLSKTKETTSREASIETEVRRSKRQRTAKRSFDTIKPISEQLKLSNHEQSVVYNMSSESGVDSPNKLKRQASDFNLPIAKKSKTISSSNVVLRSTPARKFKTQVLFTAFPSEEVKYKLEKLGAVVVTDIMQCTVVLTLQIRRTFKLLCAVGLGKPIVGPNWVQACVDTNMIVDPWQYLIKDELTEKRFQFNLERILLGNRQFLKGYNVSSTPNIMPSPPEMKLIVECSGGTWNNGAKNWICVSSKSDKSLWASLKRKGATIVSSEFILGGVLRQAIEIQRNILA